MGPVPRRANAAVRTARRRLSALRRSVLEHALLPSKGMMVWLLALLLLKLLLSKCLGDGPDIVISEELQLTRTILLSYSTSTWTRMIVLESKKNGGTTLVRLESAGDAPWTPCFVCTLMQARERSAGDTEREAVHRETDRGDGEEAKAHTSA